MRPFWTAKSSSSTRPVGRDSSCFRTTTRPAMARLVFYVFDLLYLDGRDLARPLRVRGSCSVPSGVPISCSAKTSMDRGIDFFQAAVEHGLEGIMAKDGASPYREGRRTRSGSRSRRTIARKP